MTNNNPRMLLTTTKIIETSWRAYTKNWRALIPFMVLLFIPTLALMVLGLLGVYLDSLFPSSAVISNLIIIAILIVSLLFVLWVTAALTRAVASLAGGGPGESWRQALGGALPTLWPFIYTSIFAGLVIIGGSLLFIIPGVIFSVWYVFSAYAAILDNQRGLSALKASKALVVGRWWQMLWRVFIPALLFGLLPSIIRGIIMQLLGNFLYDAPTYILVGNTLAAAVNAIFAPLSILALVLLYQSAKQNPHVPEPIPQMAK